MNKKLKNEVIHKNNIDMKKKNFGQFYTTNYKYILERLTIPENAHIIEPFVGNGDLLKFYKEKINYKGSLKKMVEDKKIMCYDLDPPSSNKIKIIKRDTLMNPPDYTDKFIITNPPYLARNKSTDKTLFDKYKVNDLYKCFIKILLTNKCNGGIMIIPLNFWSSIRKMDIALRKNFLEVYNVIRVNIFEERVFDDTSYTVCSFSFVLKNNNNDIKFHIYPNNEKLSVKLNQDNNYTIGGEIYNLQKNKKYKITRLTSKNKKEASTKGTKTNILVKCIDDNLNKRIGLSYVDDEDVYIDETDKLSSRTYASLMITPKIDEQKQKDLCNKFNEYFNKHRKKYYSLFLANYRESKDIARKRISFALVYDIVGYLLI